jgi:thiamine-phosphate pyrophosphorylase
VTRTPLALSAGPGLYAILDLPHPSGLPIEQIAAALVDHGERGGAVVLQLRAKQATSGARVTLLHELAPLCRRTNTRLILNDDHEAAIEFATRDQSGVSFGLHLGHEDLIALVSAWRQPASATLQTIRARLTTDHGPPPVLGLSTHNAAQVAIANTLPLDCIGVGPVFATTSKRAPDVCVGLDGLAAACTASSLPVIAIGGLDGARARAALRAGARYAAMISALAGRDAREIQARTTAAWTALQPRAL